MKRLLSFLLALSLAFPVMAGEIPLVIQGGQVKRLPSATALQLHAPTTSSATINIPHGTAPTSPANGDCWTTTAGFYCRINGATVGPYSTGSGNVASVDVSGGATGLIFSGGPVTTSGTITMTGTLAVANGGTGSGTSSGARSNLGAAASTITISAGTGLSGGGDLTASRTLSLANTAVSAASYGSATSVPSFTVDAQGRLTAASSNAIPVLASGTYTPTLTNGTNVAASTAYACQYMRVGNVVTVSGRFDMDPTAASTSTILDLSLPIASNFTLTQHAGGGGWSRDAAQFMAGQAEATSDVIRLTGFPTSTANAAYFFSFTYQIL